MLRVYGVKTDKETGEIIKDRTLLFGAIPENCFKQTGIKTAVLQGWTITEIWLIGILETRWADILIY